MFSAGWRQQLLALQALKVIEKTPTDYNTI